MTLRERHNAGEILWSRIILYTERKDNEPATIYAREKAKPVVRARLYLTCTRANPHSSPLSPADLVGLVCARVDA